MNNSEVAVVRWNRHCPCAHDRAATASGRRKSATMSSWPRASAMQYLVLLCVVISVSLVNVTSADEQMDRSGPGGHFMQTWAVHIPGGPDEAQRIADEHGFVNLGPIVEDHYHFHHKHVQRRSLSPSSRHQDRLDADPGVRWSQQQRAKSRQKRDYVRPRTSRTSSNAAMLNDAKWPQMWYLNRGNGLDMNVIPAWREGITGKGVVVTILDDGLESDHPDLLDNYDPKASYDVNSHDDDPMPHYDMTDSNRHGTRCAGEVAATANNSMCAVGIAYGASIGGVRMLDGDVSDAVEARSLSLNPQHIDIYSASWGPDDDGKTVDGPGDMATRAFIEGVTKGRAGKGSIFIWASGNGGREHDNCNCDGYTNSIWTLSISSATEGGHVPWYSEKCSSTLATTYSSGGTGEKQIVTTDLHHTCTVSHTGTSASAPLAAGIVALVLEANGNLTWRDLQHIVVRTAVPGNLIDSTWTKNGIGRRVSHSFGYGLMDAAAMVRLARRWNTVPEQQRCEINAPHLDKAIPPNSHIKLSLAVQHCRGVNFLEHVQAKITLTAQRRGDIVIYLTSPAGTRVTLLTSRTHDVSRSGFNNWPFMSVHTWGEAPHGSWILEIHNEGRLLAQVTQWDLVFFGTAQPTQPDDPAQTTLDDVNRNEQEHNTLEFEAGGSGHWRDMQIGENHVDVQRTTSNDQTGSACLRFSPNSQCIECLQITFLYEGRCYTACPERSFMLPESAEYNDHTAAGPPHPTQPATTESASLRRRRDTDAVAIFSDQAAIPNPPRRQKLCGACHYSCLKCRTANDYDCTACAPDSQLSERSANESYCLPIDRADQLAHFPPGRQPDQQLLYMFLVVLVPGLMIMTVVLLVWFVRNYTLCGRTERESYMYDKLDLGADGDEVEHVQVEGTTHSDDEDSSDPEADGGVERR